MKYLSIDVETTGLNEDYSSILEIAVIYDDGVSPIDKLSRFHCLVKKTTVSGDIPALVMNTEILKMCSGMSPPDTQLLSSWDAYQAFKNWFVKTVVGVPVELTRPIQQFDELVKKDGPLKFNMAGKNPAFDLKFLKKEFALFTKDFAPRHRMIDPSIAFAKWDDETIPNLDACKVRAGIEGDVSHRAMDDALDVVLLVRKHFGV